MNPAWSYTPWGRTAQLPREVESIFPLILTHTHNQYITHLLSHLYFLPYYFPSSFLFTHIFPSFMVFYPRIITYTYYNQEKCFQRLRIRRFVFLYLKVPF